MFYRRIWRRPLNGLVAASFVLTTVVPPGSFAQPLPAEAAVAEVGLACDLTGLWRSTRGPMQLVHAPVPPRPSGLVGSTGAAVAVPDEGVSSGLAGSVRIASGAIDLDGTVAGSRVDLRWYVPGGEAETESGQGYFDIGADCATLTGSYGVGSAGDFSESWVAQRIVVASGAASADSSAELASKLARIDDGMDAVQAFRDGLPRADIDIDSRAAELPGSIEAIHAYVRDAVAFEAYQGVLRGARGALVAQAGNAADQSLLLAALLQAHGYQVRFAVGTLDEPVAERLVDGMQPTPVTALAEPEPVVQARLMTVAGVDSARMAEAAAPRQAARDALLATVADDVANHGEQIAALLADNGLHLAIDPLRQRADLIGRTRAHVWVQVAENGAWTDLDPLAGGSGPGAALATAIETYDALPDEMYHVVRFRVAVERLENGALAEEQVAGWQIRMADLVDQGLPGIWIGNVPLDAPEAMAAQAAFEDLGEFAADQGPNRMLAASQFQPMLSLSTGERQSGTGFNLRGQTVPDDWRIGAAAGVAAATSGAFTGASGAIGGLFGDIAPADQTPVAPPVLTAQWIDYEVAGPGAESRSARRFVVDRIGPAARAAGVAALPEGAADDDAIRLGLAGISEIMVTTGVVSEALAFDTMLANYTRNRELLEQLADLSSGSGLVDSGFYGAYAPYPNKLLIHTLLQQEQARIAAERVGVHAYSASPTIVVRRVSIWQTPEGGFAGGQAIDLVDARLQVAPVQGMPAEHVGSFQRDYGTALTSLEHQMLGWIGRA
ncbi:MAG: transglutaminase domain-containing protein, partial [Alphaproteobacteria bacterium]